MWTFKVDYKRLEVDFLHSNKLIATSSIRDFFDYVFNSEGDDLKFLSKTGLLPDSVVQELASQGVNRTSLGDLERALKRENAVMKKMGKFKDLLDI